MDDNRIIKDFENDDGLNIEKIIEVYNSYIYSLLRNTITDNEDIQETLSDVFLILWKNHNRLDNTLKIKPYLIGITKNLIKKRYRNYNFDYVLNNLEGLENQLVSDFDILELLENSEIISDVLDSVKSKEKEIFILFYYQNKKIKTISKILNISITNTKVTLYRLRKLVKKSFKERGYNYGKQ